MTDWVSIANEATVTAGTGATFFVDDVEVAVFYADGEWHAIEGRCPHKGASLGKGQIEDGCVTCPWHDWKFDIRTGTGQTHPESRVAPIAIRVNDGTIEIDRSSLPQMQSSGAKDGDGIHRYLIRYGTPGWVSLFGTVDRVECSHKDQVVLQTHRGLELGEVLSDPADASTPAEASPSGEILRIATPEESSTSHQRSSQKAPLLIDEACDALTNAGIDLAIVDGEVLFDGKSAVLYFLGESNPDAGPLVTDVAKRHDLERIELQSMIDPPEPEGCGKPGCGGGGGGCHS